MGSDILRGSGVRILYDYRNIAVTGLTEILGRLKYICRALSAVKDQIDTEKPALVILIDFPGFNLRIAKFAKTRSVPVVYFIPPQVWAWRKSRINKIRDRVDKVICILPFEEALYRAHGIDVTYVGHPFAQTVTPTLSKANFYTEIGVRPSGPVITVLPGSRKNEIDRHMPVMLSTVRILEGSIPNLTVLLPVADNVDVHQVQRYLSGYDSIRVFQGLSHDALAHADLAIAASGSVTLEAALLGTPTIVIYQISTISYILARLLVKVRFVSLPNIILDKEFFPEFIQKISPEKIAEKALFMLNNGRESIRNDVQTLRDKLGASNSYECARNEIIHLLEKNHGPLSATSPLC